MIKQNCWEFKKCGREVNGDQIGNLGVCPAAIEIGLDTVHSGINAGRACWTITGTLCDQKVQGVYKQKIEECMKCEVYIEIKKEEGRDFILE